ncbi:hypothetical protein [Albibacterium bauzanense]|uniref:DUF2971 family protein n=1 Tax=Albibacterium bauzanense TaxID=653929 RepID=A0A4V2PXQ3_9SPHI|nr:hypothetical protein [Albibacterium bauzanense]TCK82911.1 hypothetical protein C8N28_1497 [Albibacterium bauzanense]
MPIFHYTNVQSLALILHSKKIRFTRLDLLDDLKEIDGLPDNIESSFFVSCWTEESEENLSLWSLYTRMQGVRIELPQKFYKEYKHPKGDYGHWGFSEETICPINIEEFRTDEYIISNPFWLEDGFYIKVIYDKNYKELKESAILKTEKETGINHIKNLIIYKNPIWEFQKESRFYLMANPLPPLSDFDGDRIKQMKNISLGRINNSCDHIDIGINPEVLDSIVVRLYPNCEYSDELIVRSILDKFTKNGKIEHSNLNGTYRTK